MLYCILLTIHLILEEYKWDDESHSLHQIQVSSQSYMRQVGAEYL
jgi:hypothetical protein